MIHPVKSGIFRRRAATAGDGKIQPPSQSTAFWPVLRNTIRCVLSPKAHPVQCRKMWPPSDILRPVRTGRPKRAAPSPSSIILVLRRSCGISRYCRTAGISSPLPPAPVSLPPVQSARRIQRRRCTLPSSDTLFPAAITPSVLAWGPPTPWAMPSPVAPRRNISTNGDSDDEHIAGLHQIANHSLPQRRPYGERGARLRLQFFCHNDSSGHTPGFQA